MSLPLQIETQQLTLQLENPFTIAHGTTTERHNVLVHLSDGTFTGVGEAAVVPYYNETPERVTRELQTLSGALTADPLHLHDALDRLPPMESSAAHTAIDIALHDLWGQHLGQPLFRLWGLNPARSPVSSFTVGMADNEDDYRARLRHAGTFGVVKLKLGSGDWRTDLQLVELARDTIDSALCVDANGGWDAESALTIIPQLARMDLLFVEQPVGRHDWDGWRALKDGLPADHPPLIADESVQGVDHIPALAGLVDGINIKLAKCGGLAAAQQMIALARALGLQILLGCMVESAVAITAAAHLAPLVDYADLDGNLLISNDPYQGVINDNGRLSLPEAPGLGVTPIAE